MNGKIRKNKTACLIDIMIQHADKGPSGFWTDDFEGCGNQNIFPEFEAGLKHGDYVHKDHYLCPWNTAILYGGGHVNISTGCYYSCSIKDAKSLSPEMLAAVLLRFKERMMAGCYDNAEHIKPLLTEDERSYIEKQKAIERKNQEQQWQKDRENKAIKAAGLIQKYGDNVHLKELLITHYGDNITVLSDFGNLDFSPSGKEDVVNGGKLTYDDYLDIQIQSYGKQRYWFQMCYYNMPGRFMGRIEKKSKNKKNVCFKKIYVSGMYPDGDGFKGKEDHVWMDVQGFKNYKAGDCVSFYAEVYRYIKTRNGKLLDYALRNPENIERVSSYRLPSDEDITKQSISQIICETCYLSEHCNKLYCLRNQEEIQKFKNQMFETLKKNIDGIC